MNKITGDMIGGVIFVVFGLVFAIYHVQIAHRTAEFYYKLLRLHVSEKGYRIVFLLGGIAFIVFGLLLVLQIINGK